MVAKGGDTPLTAEEMRDVVARVITGVNASDPQELARELFREDGEFSQALIEAVPRMVGAAVEALKAFAESVEDLPAEKSAELIELSYAQLDGGEIGKAVNAVSRLIIRLHEQNPELFPANRAGIVSDFMQATDFGKLRKALTYRAGEQLDLMRREVEILGDNPLALINLFSVVAPVINDTLGVLATLLEILALPPEAMTYALFKILEDLDWDSFAAVINGTAGLVVNLHRGNFILGEGSLYARGPLSRIGSDLVRGLDPQIIAEAIAAAGEEGEAFITSFANQAMDDQELVVSMLEAAISVANSSFRAAAYVLEKATTLPPETMTKMAGMLAEDLETGELGRALSYLISLGLTLHAENPGLYGNLIRDTLSAFGPEVAEAMTPQGLGAAANLALTSYNKWAGENPGLVAEGLDGFLDTIDARELERAAKTTGAQLAEAVTRHPEVMKAVIKTAFSVIYAGVKGYLSSLRGRRSVRGGG